MGMTIAEKVMARASGQASVSPGQFVDCRLDRVIAHEEFFRIHSVAVAAGLLLSSGWRPALLSTGLAWLFWVGAGVTALSVGLIGWSGCPILEVSVPVADKNKTLTMQFGTGAFIVGGAACLLASLVFYLQDRPPRRR